jgi:multidrug efflux pump subunit AcrA (membrane-fusion protein)
MKYVKWAACLVVLALCGGAVFNQETVKGPKDKKPDKEADAKPATHKVAKKPFKIELSASGMLSADENAEISYRPQPMLRPAEGQNPLTVKQVAAHGSKVKKGDVLIAFETTKMSEVIHNAEMEQKALAASIKLTEEELPIHEKTVPLELAAAEFAKKQADEELKYFLDIGKAQTEKDANLMVKYMKFYVEYAEEELVQLKKMYKANDLTEETERMILRRAQHYVEQMQAYYQSTVLRRDYVLKFALPNREKALKEDQAKSTLLLEKARKTSTPWLVQKQAALARMRHEYAADVDRLAKLRKDLAAMTLTAPMDGVVYHGRFHQGSWTVAESADGKLMPGATAQPDKVLLTVVKPRATEVHLSIDEKEVHLLKADLKGTAKLPARPDRKLAVRVASVSAAPTAPGKFAGVVQLDAGAADADLVPGLACNVKFVPYAKKDAIVVPIKCIEEEDGKDVVHVLLPNGKHETRTVTVGKSDGTHTEILAGLRENEEVLLESPSAKTASKEKGATP